MSSNTLASSSREEVNLDDIDDIQFENLLNEIDNRRESEIKAEDVVKALAVSPPVQEEEEEEDSKTDPLSDWIRSIWKVGSYCEVYSNSGKTWFKGQIKRIFTDNEGEWLEVQYVHKDLTTRCRQTPREDGTAIRPLNKALSIYKYVYNALIKTKQNNKSKKHTHKIITDKDFETNALKFNYPENVLNCNIVNNILSHTVQINIGSKCELFINNKMYELKQFYFLPSKHIIDSKQYEMEMHLVHTNKQNDTAVLGFIFTTGKKHISKPNLSLTKSKKHLLISEDTKLSDNDSGGTDDSWQEVINENENNNTPKIKKKDNKNEKDNDFLDQFWNDLPLNKTNKNIELNKSINFDYLLETSSDNFIKTVSTNEININMEIYEYKDTKNVQWLISKKTHYISEKQLEKLTKCWNNQK